MDNGKKKDEQIELWYPNSFSANEFPPNICTLSTLISLGVEKLSGCFLEPTKGAWSLGHPKRHCQRSGKVHLGEAPMGDYNTSEKTKGILPTSQLAQFSNQAKGQYTIFWY